MKQPLRVEANSAFIKGGVSFSSYVLLSKKLDKATITSYVLTNKVRIIRTNKYNVPALQTIKLLTVKNVVEQNNKKVRIQKTSLSIPKVAVTKLYNYPRPQFVKLLPSKTFGITNPTKIFRQGLGYAKAIKTLTTLVLNTPDLKSYQILNIPKILDLELVSGYADWYRYAKTLTTALRSEINSKDVVKDGFKTTGIPTSFVSKHIPRFPESNVGVIDPVDFYITARYINRFLVKDTFKNEFKPNKKSISFLESLHEIQTFPEPNTNLGVIQKVKVEMTDKSLTLGGIGRTGLVRKNIIQKQLLRVIFESSSKLDTFHLKESRLSTSQLTKIIAQPIFKDASIARNFLVKFTRPTFSSSVKFSNSKEKIYPIKNIRNTNIVTSNFKLDSFGKSKKSINKLVTNYQHKPVFDKESLSNIRGSFVKPEFFKNLKLETRISSTVFKDMKGPKKSTTLMISSPSLTVSFTNKERALAKDRAKVFFKVRKRTVGLLKSNFINTSIFNVSNNTKLSNTIFKGRFLQNNINFSSNIEREQNTKLSTIQDAVSRLENKIIFNRKNVSLIQTSFRNRMRLARKDVSATKSFTERFLKKISGTTEDPTLSLVNADTDDIRPGIELAETYLVKSRAYLGRFIQNVGTTKEVLFVKPIITLKSNTGAFAFREHLPILNKKSIGILPNTIFKGRFIQNVGLASSDKPEKIAKPFITSNIGLRSGNQYYDPETGKVEFSKKPTSVQADNIRLPNLIFKGRFIQNAGSAKQKTDILPELRKDTISKTNNFIVKKPHIVLYSPERTTGTYGVNQNKVFKGRFVQNNIGGNATIDKKRPELVKGSTGSTKTFIAKKAEISPTRNLPNKASFNNLFFKGRFIQNNLKFSSTIDHLDMEISLKDTSSNIYSFIATRANVNRLFDKSSLKDLIYIGTIIKNRTAAGSSIYRKDIETSMAGTRVGGIRHKLIWGFDLKFEFLASVIKSFDIPAYAVHPRNTTKIASDKALRKVFLDFGLARAGIRELPEKLFNKTLGFLPDKASFRSTRIPAYAVLPKSKNVITSFPVKIEPLILHKSNSLARMSIIDLDYILHDQFSNVSLRDTVFKGQFIPASQVRLRDGEIVFKTSESVTKSVSSLQDDIFKKINSEIYAHRTLYTNQIFKGRVVHSSLNFISDTKTTFNKKINNSLSLTAKAAKTLTRTLHKYPSRNISNTDGYLFNQNYVEGYFAEPYVGEARSFGNFRF